MTNTHQHRNTINGKLKNNKTFAVTLMVLFMLPWPHGGELVWQYLLFCIAIFSLTAMYFIKSTKKVNHSFSRLKVVKTPLILLVAWLLFQLFQTIPLPLSFVSITEQSFNTTQWQFISVAHNVTLLELIKHSSYICFFVLALLLLNTKKRIVLLANTLFISSAIIALYSLANHYTQGAFDLISSIPPWTVAWEKSAHGTFSYQNHYASFLTLTIPLGYGLIYASIKKNNGLKVDKNNLRKAFLFLMSKNGLYLLCLLIMTTALFKTASRGGNSIFIIGIGITFFSVLLQQNTSIKEKIKKSSLLVITMITIGAIVFFTGITDPLTKRLESQGYNPNGRTLMHSTAIKIIKQRPLVGTGAGTYPILQHMYKSPNLGITAMSKRAHNDYLELLANQGFIGFALLGAATLLILLRLFKGLKKNEDATSKSLQGFKIASFCSVITILLHSLADFNFHLPVNTVYYYVIIAIGIKANQLSMK